MYKRIYFIGGTSEFSKQVVEDLEKEYNYDVTAVGRRTGHHVKKTPDSEGNKRIIDEALQYDAIINFSFSQGAQYELVLSLFKEFLQKNWEGYFINFGSSITLHNKSSMDNLMDPWDVFYYTSKKFSIHHLGQLISRRFMINPFRFTTISCGMLDNEKMRKVPNYRSTCIKPHDLSNLINYCLSSPPNWHLHEIVFDAK